MTIAWTLLTGRSREVFRSELAVDDSVWARSRGWTLWKALLELRSHRQSDPTAAAKAYKVIDDILSPGRTTTDANTGSAG